MTSAEHRALTRAAAVLLVSGLVRWGWQKHRGPPVLPPDKEDQLPRLLAEARALKDEADRRSRPLAEGERLQLNRVDEAELDRLPGVGETTAREIARVRGERGGFGTLDELLEVRGIGPATLERIRPHVSVEAGMRVADRASVRPTPTPSRGASGATPVESLGRGRSPPRVNVNEADEAGLVALPGIGPALASRIVEERERNGRFGTVDELTRVRGIGPATVERIRGMVDVR